MGRSGLSNRMPLLGLATKTLALVFLCLGRRVTPGVSAQSFLRSLCAVPLACLSAQRLSLWPRNCLHLFCGGLALGHPFLIVPAIAVVLLSRAVEQKVFVSLRVVLLISLQCLLVCSWPRFLPSSAVERALSSVCSTPTWAPCARCSALGPSPPQQLRPCWLTGLPSWRRMSRPLSIKTTCSSRQRGVLLVRPLLYVPFALGETFRGGSRVASRFGSDLQ